MRIFFSGDRYPQKSPISDVIEPVVLVLLVDATGVAHDLLRSSRLHPAGQSTPDRADDVS
jgi:hypothetical protein